jgi:hypothetical protein
MAEPDGVYRKPKIKTFNDRFGEFDNANDSDEAELKIF